MSIVIIVYFEHIHLFDPVGQSSYFQTLNGWSSTKYCYLYSSWVYHYVESICSRFTKRHLKKGKVFARDLN